MAKAKKKVEVPVVELEVITNLNPPVVEKVEVPVKVPTKDRAIKELLALKEQYLPRNKSPGGKELRIYRVANTSLLRIQWADGGALAPEISGMYTSSKLANDAIQMYLTKMWNLALDTDNAS